MKLPKKPKMKKIKKGGYWLVYLTKDKMCKCYSERAAKQWYEVLTIQINREKEKKTT